MQSQYITFQDAKGEIDVLLKEEKTRIEKISVFDLAKVAAYIDAVNKEINNSKAELEDALYSWLSYDIFHSLLIVNRGPTEDCIINKDKHADKYLQYKLQLRSLDKLLFDLQRRQYYLEANARSEQFLMFSILSDNIQKILPDKNHIKPDSPRGLEDPADELNPSMESKNTPTQLMLAARERVTLEVLQNHDILTNKTRELITDKDKLETSLKEKNNQIQEHTALIHSLADESKKSQEQVAMLSNQVQEQLTLIRELQSDLKEKTTKETKTPEIKLEAKGAGTLFSGTTTQPANTSRGHILDSVFRRINK